MCPSQIGVLESNGDCDNTSTETTRCIGHLPFLGVLRLNLPQAGIFLTQAYHTKNKLKINAAPNKNRYGTGFQLRIRILLLGGIFWPAGGVIQFSLTYTF